MTSPPLDVLQRWMLAVIAHPAGVEAGLISEQSQAAIPLEPDQLASVIPPSQRCSSLQRLGVYSHAYFARLFECLSAEFPATKHAAGDDAFAQLALQYLQRHPPSSYTLAQLGADFPASLQETRPPREDAGSPDWADFLIDLARLERIYSEVFDGPGEEHDGTLSSEQLRSLRPEQFAQIRLIPARSLRLEEFRFPVHEYATAVRRRGESPDWPAANPVRLAIHRRDFVVRRVSLSRIQFELLKGLTTGRTLNEALQSVLAEFDDHDNEISPALIQQWFQVWTASGFFRGLTLDDADQQL